MQVGFGDSGNSWQGPPVDFRSGRGAGMVPVPCGSSGNSAQRSGAVSGVSGRNSTGAQSHMARRPSVTSDAPRSTQRTSFTGGGTGVSDSAGMADDNSNMGLARASSERDASDVFMDELIGVPQADVEKHQTMFVQYDGLTTGQVATEWKQQDAMKVASMAHRKPAAVAAEFAGLPLSCSVRIIQAPAAFARPMVQKKPFRPHFVVRLEVRYQGRIDFPVTMGAFPLSDSLYSKPSSLKPSAALNDSEVEGLLVTQTVTNDMADEATGRGKATEERTLTADFEFPDLKFVKSSRMFKRWLVFSFKIREDHVYVTYDLPTVILSRKTDQFGKAYEKLTGGPPPLKRARVPAPSVSPAPSAPSAPGRASGGLAGSRWGGGARPNVSMMKIDVQQAENWIVSKYHEYLPNAQRTLSDQDIVWLLHKAELNPNVQEAVMVAGHKWEQFEEWYTKCLETLQSVEATWDQTEPEIICGFRIDRRRAEQILQTQPPGAFLVRLCSEPGCFAVSCRTRTQDPFNHLLLDRVDLQRRRLLLWIQAHDAAKMLINTRTGQRIPKENVLDTGFYKMPNFIEPQGTGYYGGDTMGGCGGNGGGGGGNMMNAVRTAFNLLETYEYFRLCGFQVLDNTLNHK